MLKRVPGPAVERGAKIARYNSEGQETQTIQYTWTGRKLFTYPVYIAENLNGDVMESDWNRVVVTDREGEIRFCYPDNRHEELSPWGICTDSLLHILICDTSTYTVRMLDKVGYFLQYLLTTEDGITEFRSLSYDYKIDLLWVGSLDDNTVFVFKYIEKENTPQDDKDTIMEKAIEKDFPGTKSASTTKISETEGATQVSETEDPTDEVETTDSTEVTKTGDITEITDTKDPTDVAETKYPPDVTETGNTTEVNETKDATVFEPI
ncbi:uncharacterized protein LOC134271064 [Saccostrea cucullata]|uniref:uncharacterized protein LOC134271064 n=1 Tax=Saccostrea cuccullata TaxID=36930 RepID=UPI002ED3F617